MKLMPIGTFTPRVWRVRAWIRVSAILPAALIIALVIAYGLQGESSLLGGLAMAFFLVVVPFLALWPLVRLYEDGSLFIRDWVGSRRTNVSEIARLSMTPYGARFDLRDGSKITSVIFQATLHLKYPRVFDFIEAISSERPLLETWNPYEAAGPDGIVLFRNPEIDRPLTNATAYVDASENPPVPFEISRAFEALYDYVRGAVGGRAEIVRTVVPGTAIHVLGIVPVEPGARAINIICELFLIVTVGRDGAGWELAYNDDDLTKAKQIVDDVVAGRVSERSALWRSRVTVTHEDGMKESSWNYQGCLAILIPLPGWHLWGRRTDYEPY